MWIFCRWNAIERACCSSCEMKSSPVAYDNVSSTYIYSSFQKLFIYLKKIIKSFVFVCFVWFFVCYVFEFCFGFLMFWLWAYTSVFTELNIYVFVHDAFMLYLYHIENKNIDLSDHGMFVAMSILFSLGEWRKK